MPEHTRGSTARPPSPNLPPRAQLSDPDEDVLAAVYIRMWALASGRRLRSDVAPGQLDKEELIAFWADDMTEYAGRHARPEETRPSPAAGNPDGASRSAAKPRRRKRRRSGGKTAGNSRTVRAGTAPA